MKKCFLIICAITMIAVVAVGCSSNNKNLGGSTENSRKEAKQTGAKGGYSMRDAGIKPSKAQELKRVVNDYSRDFLTMQILRGTQIYLYEEASKEIDFLEVAEARYNTEQLVRLFLESQKIKGKLHPDFVDWVADNGLPLDEENFLGIRRESVFNTRDVVHIELAIVKFKKDYVLLVGAETGFTRNLNQDLDNYMEDGKWNQHNFQMGEDFYDGIGHLIAKLESLNIHTPAEVNKIFINGYRHEDYQSSYDMLVKALDEKGVIYDQLIIGGELGRENSLVNPDVKVTVLEYDGYTVALALHSKEDQPYEWFYDGIPSEDSEAEEEDVTATIGSIPAYSFQNWVEENNMVIDKQQPDISIKSWRRELNSPAREFFFPAFEQYKELDSIAQNEALYMIPISDSDQDLLESEVLSFVVLTGRESVNDSEYEGPAKFLIVGKKADIEEIVSHYG